MIWYLFSSIVFALAGLLVYLYYSRQGQFDDIEDIKYQMFREDHDA